VTVRVDEECCGRGGAISRGCWCMATESDDGAHGQCYYFQTPFLYAKMLPPEYSLRVLFHNLHYMNDNNLRFNLNNTKAMIIAFDTSITMNTIVNHLVSSMFTYIQLNKMNIFLHSVQNYHGNLLIHEKFNRNTHLIYVIANKIRVNKACVK